MDSCALERREIFDIEAAVTRAADDGAGAHPLVVGEGENKASIIRQVRRPLQIHDLIGRARGGLGDIPSPGRAGAPPASARSRRVKAPGQVFGPKSQPFRQREIAGSQRRNRKFVDSPLEEGGFELSVPRHGEVTAALRYAISGGIRGTGSDAAGRNSASLRRWVIQPSARTLERSLFTAEIGR